MSGSRTPARRWSVPVLATAALLIVPTACGDDDDSSKLCDEYAAVTHARAELDGTDFSQASATTATQLLQSYRQSVLKMQDADDDGTYEQELTALETALDDTLATLDTVDDTATADVWGPLVETSLGQVRDASAQVDASVGADCSGS